MPGTARSDPHEPAARLTAEEALDEALEETFPASDPISPALPEPDFAPPKPPRPAPPHARRRQNRRS